MINVENLLSDNCVPYIETVKDQFNRINSYFKESAINKIISAPEATDKDTILLVYGLRQQGLYGDLDSERPEVYKIIERVKWDSWNS